MDKKYMSLLLCLVMVLTLMPTMAFASNHPASEHGGWTLWDDSTSLPATSGAFYLTTDVAISTTWNVQGTTDLCLNGHVIKASGSGISVITISSGAALSLFDCSDTPHKFDVDDSNGLYTLNESSGTVVVSGGCITGGYSTSCGGVYVHDGGVFNMYGGTIVGNAADRCGGGVYFESGNVTLGGIAKIVNNIISGGGIASNLYIASGQAIGFNADCSPAQGMSVGISTEALPAIGSPVIFTSTGAEAYAGHFFSDNSDYYVTHSEGGTSLILDYGYPVFVGGVHVTKDNKHNVLNDETVSYDPDTQTLTLNNANITTYYGNEDGSIGIYSLFPDTQTLKIELIGNNVIGESITTAPRIGINPLSGDLILSGSGDLTIYSLMSGIYSSGGDIDFDDAFTGKLVVNNYGGEYYYAIYASGYVSISSGTFEIDSVSGCGIGSSSVVINGGSLTIKGTPSAIIVEDSFLRITTAPAIAAGLPVIASTNYDGSNPDETYSPDAIDTYKYLKIGTVTEPTPTPAPDYSDYVAPKTKTFVDVTADDYFYNAVKWAAAKKITEGTDADHFSPDAPVTRAQAVTFLWRAAGCPKPASGTSKFTDVEAGSYYEKAVAWAVEKGITKGTTGTTFSPEEICSRAQIITFLARFAGVEDAVTESIFTDVKSTAYYAAAVKWAKDNGITDGSSETRFRPDDDCSRAQTVTFLYRWRNR